MEDEQMLARLKAGDPSALESAINKYASYVQTIVSNKAEGLIFFQDREEIVSDVFVSLWKNSGQIRTGHLKGWIAAAARNRTVDFLRKRKSDIPLEEKYFIVDDEVWQSVDKEELRILVRNALDMLSEQDKEIFLRYYDLYQPIGKIAEAMDMTYSAVRTRLSRGRQALKKELKKGGISIEDCI